MMSFLEFLALVKVFKMIYGRDVAQNILEKNLHKYYNLDSESLSKLMKGEG